MKLEDALQALKDSDTPMQFACDNPHWWIGRNAEGRFTYDYECCDLCEEEGNNDHQILDTIDELRETLGHFDDSAEWLVVTT